MKKEHEIRADNVRFLRASVLATARPLFPHGLMRSSIEGIGDSFGFDEADLDREIAYMRLRGWIQTEKITVLGRPNLKITLTATGYDIASNINPTDPILPE